MAFSSSSSYSSPGNNFVAPVSSPSAPIGPVSTLSPPSMINSPSNAPSSPSSSSISTPRDPSLQPLPTNSYTMTTRTKFGVPLPRLNPSIFLLHFEPKSVKVALQDPKWFTAMQEEYDALERNKTWSLVPLPPNRKAIGCKWVFRV